MTLLPALVTAALLDAYAQALTPSQDPATTGTGTALATVTDALADGVPARLPLDATRSLVLAVPLGVARPLLDADPLAVVVDVRRPRDPGLHVPVDQPAPRLTLVVDGRIGDSAPVVPGTPVRLGSAGRALVEVVVDRLVVTAGTLRGPGRFDSTIVLRWADLVRAGRSGPAPVAADPALAVLSGARR